MEKAWTAFHFFYHSERLDLLRHFVRPLLPEIFGRGLADRFFYVFYSLGGPHLRLRFRVEPGSRYELAALLDRRADAFLAERPARDQLPEEEIRRTSRAILAVAPEDGELFYPNNSLVPFAFTPETERYGGPSRLPDALDFFCVSSALCLEAVAASAGATPAQRWALSLRVLLRQAFSFAADAPELSALLGYRLPIGDELVDAVLAKADAAFARNAPQYGGLARRELERLAGESAGESAAARFAAAARELSRRTGNAAAEVRWQLAHSQLHMTANRLGHTPAEELYLLRLLLQALRETAASEPAVWQRLEAAQRERLRSGGDPSLAELAAGLRDFEPPLEVPPRPPQPSPFSNQETRPT